MTKDEAEGQVISTGYCTPELYHTITGRQWNGTTRFIFLDKQLDIGYRIKALKPGGRVINPASARQRQPWLVEGISQATYYRRQATEARFTAIFFELGCADTVANRKAFVSLRSTSKVLGVPFPTLWAEYIKTVGTPQAVDQETSLPTSQASGGEATLFVSSSDNDTNMVHPPSEACAITGPCEHCHLIHT